MRDYSIPERKFSVVIPSYNDTGYMERCLAALYSNDAGARFNVVVVNDHSNVSHSAQLERWSKDLDFALLVLSKRYYFTRTINYGLQYAYNQFESWFYFLLNSDVFMTPGWGAAIEDCYKETGAHIIGCVLLYPDGRIQHLGGYGEGYHTSIENHWIGYKENRLVPWVTGAAMAIHRQCIAEAGLLPIKEIATQYDHSDRDYAVLARQTHGFEIAIASGAVGYHFTHESRKMRQEAGHIPRNLPDARR